MQAIFPAKLRGLSSRGLTEQGVVNGFSFVVGDFTERDWYSHEFGIVLGVSSGLLGVRTETSSVVLSSGTMIYLPPDSPRSEQNMHVGAEGWVLAIPAARSRAFGNQPKVLEVNELVEALAYRITRFSDSKSALAAQRKIEEVFFDEMLAAAPANPLSIPLPSSLGLLRVATEVFNSPGDKKGVDHWAGELGVARRTFTLQFRRECGLSFVAWRQRVKIYAGLRLMAGGMSVSEASAALAFPNPSFFIQVFKKVLGTPPERYLREKISLRKSHTVRKDNT